MSAILGARSQRDGASLHSVGPGLRDCGDRVAACGEGEIAVLTETLRRRAYEFGILPPGVPT